MRSGIFAQRSTCPLAKRNLLAGILNRGLLARATLFIAIVVLAVSSFYSGSSASAPGGTAVRQVDARGSGIERQPKFAAHLAGPSSVVNSWLLAPIPPPLPGAIQTFAANCTTPKTEFHVGDTICAKVTGITVSPSFPRLLTWAGPDSTVVNTTSITTDPQSVSFVINATSVVNGRTIDNRGTWQLLIRNPFFFFPEASAAFTVTDPQNAVADLGVAVTAKSNSVAAGSQAVFEIQVNNYGPDTSTNVQLTDMVPANTTFVSFQQLNGPIFTCSSPAVGDTGTTTCSIASLDWPDNAVATFIATYLIDSGVGAGTAITNTGNIASVAAQNSPATLDQNDKDDSSSADELVTSAPCALTCPANIDVNADAGQAGAVVTYSNPSSTGDCGQPVTGEGGEVTPAISCSPASGSFFPAGTTTVVCSGQTNGVCTFQVTVQNPGGLSITLNGANPFALECGDDFDDPGATAINGSGQNVPVVVSGTVDNHAPGSYSLTYTASEGANSTSTTRTVNVSDSAGPVITIAGSNPLTLSCGQTYTDPGVSANDACEGSKSVASSGTVNSNVPGTYTITYTASDSANHTSTATRTVIVEAGGGTSAPTITLNGDPQMTVECGNFTDPGATASVPCGGSVPVTTSGTVSNAPGTYTITYTACIEDTPGHCDPARTSHADRTVIVEDHTAPTITVNGANPQTVECHSTFTDLGATAHDGCVGNSAATASGSVDANTVGTYTITYNAQDPSGNSATPVTRTVNVVDTTAPTITLSGANPMTVECHTSFTDPGATANDSCSGPVAVTASGTVNANAVGTYTITYSATDGSNSASATRTVNVVDTINPVITLNGANPMTIECHTGFTDPGATASDSCSGNLTSAISVSGSVNPDVAGDYTLTYSVSDGSNSQTATRSVHVVDSTAPTITLNGANPLTVECHTSFSDPGATAHDSCAGDFAATASGTVNVNVVGSYTITYNAHDPSGNNAAAVTRTVNVVDTTAPTITLNGQTPSLWPANHKYQTFQVTNFVSSVTDSCNTSLGVSSVVIAQVTSDETENGNGDGNTLNDIVIAGDCKSLQVRAERDGGGNGRVYTITFRVRDASGNASTATAKIVVPHNPGETPIDSGPHYTVTGTCP
ncbi:MAG: uncharacterized protein JWM21_4562 [Acidobacteria bacterium]|nr:uncharacterized protein [Acidobacteriota bacterium]